MIHKLIAKRQAEKEEEAKVVEADGLIQRVLHQHIRTSLNGFALGLSLLPVNLLILPGQKFTGFGLELKGWQLVHLLHPLTIGSLIYLYWRRRKGPEDSEKKGVLLRSFFLGWTFAAGWEVAGHLTHSPFGVYMMLMSFFHYSEFLTTAIINPEALSLDSFLLNHSKEYGLAALASWLEYGIESLFFPGLKQVRWCLKSGLMLCIGGELIRKIAMFTAGSNFTHLVRERKVDGHKLIKTGIYSICRHPSYAGWFWWSIGTQLVLINPICSIGYTLASWKFFSRRILYEEATLLSFFGHQYFEYQRIVKTTGVPFVSGYQNEKD